MTASAISRGTWAQHTALPPEVDGQRLRHLRRPKREAEVAATTREVCALTTVEWCHLRPLSETAGLGLVAGWMAPASESDTAAHGKVRTVRARHAHCNVKSTIKRPVAATLRASAVQRSAQQTRHWCP